MNLQHRVSSTEQLIHHTQMGFDPPYARRNDLLNEKVDNLTHQAARLDTLIKKFTRSTNENKL